MITSILYPVLANEVGVAGLDLACELARQHDARLVAVVCSNSISPYMMPANFYPFAIYDALGASARENDERLLAELRARLEKADVLHEVRAQDSLLMTPSEAAATQARYSDLVVFGRVPGADANFERACFADLLLQSGRPVLMVPAANAASLEGEAMIAWKPTLEASRAVHDSLPLLKRLNLVQVVCIEPQVGDTRHGEVPGADIATHLVGHGLRVEVVVRAREGLSTGEALVRHSRERGVGLLVAGGYGHRRGVERLFGGVTRTLFDLAVRPVLFSH